MRVREAISHPPIEHLLHGDMRDASTGGERITRATRGGGSGGGGSGERGESESVHGFLDGDALLLDAVIARMVQRALLVDVTIDVVDLQLDRVGRVVALVEEGRLRGERGEKKRK